MWDYKPINNRMLDRYDGLGLDKSRLSQLKQARVIENPVPVPASLGGEEINRKAGTGVMWLKLG
jgi:hypothetical protein